MLAAVRFTIWGLLGLLHIFSSSAVTLVGTEYPTLFDNKGDASRYQAILEEAFKRMDRPVDVQVMRQAFVGSALRSERADGEAMFLALNDQDERMFYSDAFMPVRLYLTSREQETAAVGSFFHIEDARVATENRFANTDQLRTIDVIKWSRNPSTFDAFRQLADERADYLLADGLLIREFNKLLTNAERPELVLSPQPLVATSMHISLRRTLANAKSILEQFNRVVADMQADGTYNRLLQKPWLLKDVNQDGSADLITSAGVAHPNLTDLSSLHTYPLDQHSSSDTSVYVIDGKVYTDFAQAAATLKTEKPARTSLLDKDRYARMIRNW